jgi:hypothetical protein
MCAVVAALLGTGSLLAAPPTVLKAAPDNGAKDVDPGLKEFRVTFDQPMSSGGMSIVGGGPSFPKFVGKGRWADERTLVMTWQLEGEHDYWLSINSDRFTNFRSRQGESAVPYPISFRTGKRTTPSVEDQVERNREAYEHLQRAIKEDYSYWDLRRVDWDKRFEEFARRLWLLPTPRKFAETMAELLSPAEDVHLWMAVDGDSIPTYKRRAVWNVSTANLPRLVPGWQQRSPAVFSGNYEDGIRYLCIRNWPADKPDQLEGAYEVLAEAAGEKKPLIIDVRANGGGAEPLAAQFAGCFVDRPVAYAKHAIRRDGKFSEPVERVLKPNKARPHFQGRVAVLIGLGTVSSCESFAMMMKQAPGCTLLGQRTAGASGNPRPVELGNGVTLYVPSWKDLRLDGTCLEGEGLAPDVEVKAEPQEFSAGDPVLAAALSVLRKTP